ncbi:hypothetical protein CTEN210_18086 [Chaetoceros tenuissimus]|uniref:Uncharacterized protein n=1 Tax=Chaetoceros tenuissimus TaxID=426638 RepID=A0AAD3HFD5_9STRA|nr:hypothetical protein CTEN210_18086 [Chaetoceros tenuissimus]
MSNNSNHRRGSEIRNPTRTSSRRRTGNAAYEDDIRSSTQLFFPTNYDASVPFPFRADEYQQHKEDASGPFHQKFKNIPDDILQEQEHELTSEERVRNGNIEENFIHSNTTRPTISDMNTNFYQHSVSSCNFTSSNVEAAASSADLLLNPPLYISTIDRSNVYDDKKVTTTKNAQFDRRVFHIDKRYLERSQTEHINCERLESLDYTVSNIRQASLPDVGASFRDIFDDEVEERKAASDIYQYPRRRIQKRSSMDLSAPIDRNEVDRLVTSNLRRKKSYQSITPSSFYTDPISLSTHDIVTATTIATTAEEFASTEKAHSAPVSMSSYNHSRLRFYDTGFLQDMTKGFQQNSDIHTNTNKEISNSSIETGPLCKPSLKTVISQGAEMVSAVDISKSCRTLPCFHGSVHSTNPIKSEKAYSAPIHTDSRENTKKPRPRRERFYDSTFLNEFQSYEKLYTEEELYLSSDLSPPEDKVHEVKPSMKAKSSMKAKASMKAKPSMKEKSRSKVQDNSNMLLSNIDNEYATRFSYLVFSQIEVCSLTESDDKGKRSGMHQLGFKGMTCKYCHGKSTHDGIKSGRGGRYFPKSIKTLADTAKTLMSISNHLKQCKDAPNSMRKEIVELQKTHKEEQKAKPRGSHSKFCQQMWERLHGPFMPPKKNESESK